MVDSEDCKVRVTVSGVRVRVRVTIRVVRVRVGVRVRVSVRRAANVARMPAKSLLSSNP